MLLVFFFLYLIQWFLIADAVPLSVMFPRQTNIGPSFAQECVCPDTRSKWDIVWSCLVTIFACSWVSVHPNIPGPREAIWKKALRRLELMFWSVISPELIIFWASKQWVAARYLASEYSKDGWTMIHSHFMLMGGFMLYDGDNAVGVLGPEKLKELLSKKKIVMPTITEEEIQDKSKGDGLSKAIVVIQTAWFIAQCFARRIRGLIITELELVTLAFAALNFVMYFLWWDKPLDVATTFPVYLLQPTPPQSPGSANPGHEEPQECAPEQEPNDVGGTLNVRETESSSFQEAGSQSLPEKPIPLSKMHTNRIRKTLNLRNLASQLWWLISGILFRWPVAWILVLASRFGDIWETNTIPEGQMQVPTFYAYNASQSIGTMVEFVLPCALPFVGVVFGAIHCAGWNFLFPSLIESFIWRVSSAVITGIPAIGVLAILLLYLEINGQSNSLVKMITTVTLVSTLLLLPFYMLARLALLVEALISLRDLLPGALAVVEWTSLVPHA